MYNTNHQKNSYTGTENTTTQEHSTQVYMFPPNKSLSLHNLFTLKIIVSINLFFKKIWNTVSFRNHDLGINIWEQTPIDVSMWEQFHEAL